MQKIVQILEMINKLLHGSTTNLKKIVMSFEMERLQTLKMQEILISNPIMKSCLVGTFPFKKKLFLSIFLHLRHRHFLRGGWQKLVKFANGYW